MKVKSVSQVSFDLPILMTTYETKYWLFGVYYVRERGQCVLYTYVKYDDRQPQIHKYLEADSYLYYHKKALFRSHQLRQLEVEKREYVNKYLNHDELLF